ncbi:MAG: Spore germination protein YndE [Pelotomaculum sp. PtaB.Bin013]|uniref:Endospore germination permease n=1 Tax=Pelotomaculum isophthalicicum JI TaxID=947010 RepID=A0A9X4H419_9FIRM|nr:endospore germination permease [Pelotomaculum isophthalicicum]MDF9408403.1 endospore germination permease [Pelotomaculum isophthalicicum JI]OPX87890.1 MAG: Spore germination protein YndE [Pelotomaculum sp. PtaB.Bin013]
MLEGGKISSKQAIFLMVSMVLPTAFLFMASVTARLAKQDGWISLLLATLAVLLIARLVVNLSLRFPGKTIFQFPEVILGRWPGKVIALLYIWWLINLNSEILRQFGSFMVAAFMPETPIIVFELLIMVIAAYAVRNGLEVFTRANEVLLPVILGMVLVVNILLIPELDLKRLLPVYIDNGVVPVIKGSVMPAVWLGEIAVMAVLIPCLNKAKEAYRVAAAATIITGGILIFSYVNSMALYGPEAVAGWIFPSLNKVRMVHIATFLERLEAIIMFVWVAGGLVKICIFYWAAALGSAQWLELNDYKPLVLPVGVILLALSVMAHDSILDLYTYLSTSALPLSIVFQAGIPLLLLVVAVFRGQGGARQ